MAFPRKKTAKVEVQFIPSSWLLKLRRPSETIIELPDIQRLVRDHEESLLQTKSPFAFLSKLARRVLQIHKIPKNLIWQFTILSEMSSLYPIRVIAREFGRSVSGKITLVLRNRDFTYFDIWSQNDLALIYFGMELLRNGNEVKFAFVPRKMGERITGRQGSDIEIQPAQSWYHNRHLTISGGQALAHFPIRNSDKVWQDLTSKSGSDDDISVNLEGLFSLPKFHFDLASAKFTFDQNSRSYTRTLSLAAVYRLFFRWVRASEASFFEQLDSILSQEKVDKVHMCDHPDFLGSGLYALAKSKNLNIEIWPHSTNSIASNFYEEAPNVKAVIPLRRNKSIWGVKPKTEVRSEFLLTEQESDWVWDQNAPITLIYIAGMWRYNYMPGVQMAARKKCMTRTFSQIAKIKTPYNLLIKIKGSWENMSHLRPLFPRGLRHRRTRVRLDEIQETNSVFFTIGSGSSALLEGISRGIPCFTVRDYDDVDSAPVPGILTPNEFIEAIENLKSDQFRHNCLKRQEIFYREQTCFPDKYS